MCALMKILILELTKQENESLDFKIPWKNPKTSLKLWVFLVPKHLHYGTFGSCDFHLNCGVAPTVKDLTSMNFGNTRHDFCKWKHVYLLNVLHEVTVLLGRGGVGACCRCYLTGTYHNLLSHWFLHLTLKTNGVYYYLIWISMWFRWNDGYSAGPCWKWDRQTDKQRQLETDRETERPLAL